MSLDAAHMSVCATFPESLWRTHSACRLDTFVETCAVY